MEDWPEYQMSPVVDTCIVKIKILVYNSDLKKGFQATW